MIWFGFFLVLRWQPPSQNGVGGKLGFFSFIHSVMRQVFNLVMVSPSHGNLFSIAYFLGSLKGLQTEVFHKKEHFKWEATAFIFAP